jgi:predicted DNA-binding transcriptional regulator AlpA
MNDIILTQIDKRELIKEIAEEVVSRLTQNIKPTQTSEELIQIPDAMKLLGRSRTTINNWRKEGFLKEQVINTRVYFKKSDVLNAGHQINGKKK